MASKIVCSADLVHQAEDLAQIKFTITGLEQKRQWISIPLMHNDRITLGRDLTSTDRI
jgi:hypothetical protein